jgi:hypothetical protein
MSVVSIDRKRAVELEHGIEGVTQALAALGIATDALAQIADYSLCMGVNERADRAMQALRDIKQVIVDG